MWRLVFLLFPTLTFAQGSFNIELLDHWEDDTLMHNSTNVRSRIARVGATMMSLSLNRSINASSTGASAGMCCRLATPSSEVTEDQIRRVVVPNTVSRMTIENIVICSADD